MKITSASYSDPEYIAKKLGSCCKKHEDRIIISFRAHLK